MCLSLGAANAIANEHTSSDLCGHDNQIEVDESTPFCEYLNHTLFGKDTP